MHLSAPSLSFLFLRINKLQLHLIQCRWHGIYIYSSQFYKCNLFCCHERLEKSNFSNITWSLTEILVMTPPVLIVTHTSILKCSLGLDGQRSRASVFKHEGRLTTECENLSEREISSNCEKLKTYTFTLFVNKHVSWRSLRDDLEHVM